jgi:hypothetical protein
MILWELAHLCICPGKVKKNSAVISTGRTNTIHSVLNQIRFPFPNPVF